MAKTPGSGRKPGTPNKKSLRVLEILKELDYDPLVSAIKMLQQEPMSDEEIEEAYDKYIEECDDKMIELEDYQTPSEFRKEIEGKQLDPDKRLDGHIKLIKYIYPARKAIEVKTDDNNKAPVFTINMKPEIKSE